MLCLLIVEPATSVAIETTTSPLTTPLTTPTSFTYVDYSTTPSSTGATQSISAVVVL